MIWCKVKKLHSAAKMPEFKSAQAAGADLYAVEEQAIAPGFTARVRLGIALELRPRTCAWIMGRSSLNARGVVASLGLIDSDYRGEIAVVLQNNMRETFFIAPGDRIGQIVIMPLPQTVFMESDALSGTERGTGGFGSTGV